MAHRLFTDPDGTTWLVLAVYPYVGDRRAERDRRGAGGPPPVERRSGADRRGRVREEMEEGWLLFKGDRGRRRFVPIIAGWESAPLETLLDLLARAVPARLANQQTPP